MRNCDLILISKCGNSSSGDFHPAKRKRKPGVRSETQDWSARRRAHPGDTRGSKAFGRIWVTPFVCCARLLASPQRCCFTLALCIGINTAVFTLVDALLLTPLPYRDPTQLVLVNSSDMFKFLFSAAAFNEWKKESSLLQDSALDLTGQAIMLGGSEPMRVRIDITTANLPELLGEKPLVGRLFLPGDDEALGGGKACDPPSGCTYAN